MATEDPGKDGPSLELPSLGFRRKRRKKGPAAVDERASEPAGGSGSEPTPEPEPTPTPGPDPVPDPGPVEPAPTPEPVEPAPTPEPVAAPPLFVDEVSPRPTAVLPVRAPAAESAAAPMGDARPERRPSRIGGLAAAVVTGLLVGLVTVGLTWSSLRLCEAARGTSSCGNPGILLLIAILVVTVVLGALVLRLWGVADPGSTSLLAVGLLAVLALLFLVDVLFSWWMIVVIPLFSMATFALSHWVTTAITEPADH